jgi:uncharacterized protein YdaU (DUF1376 family)
MNFYKHHIGDYAQATSHLSFVEDAAYSRMIRKYYAEEKPLPADIRAVQRLVGARTKEEKQAVEDILNEFFELQDDGWHNKRCDAELAANCELETEREAKAANERERQKRHREERSKLFEKLREFDIVPAYDTKTETLRSLLANAECHAPVTRDNIPMSQPVTQPVTRNATANQTPDARHQTPDIKPSMDTSSHQSNVTDGDDPQQPGEWFGWFNRHHGTQYDATSLHDRKKLMTIFTGWHNARVTAQQVNAAVRRALSESTEPIANLAAYVDRVLANSTPRASKPGRTDARETVAQEIWGTQAGDSDHGRTIDHEQTGATDDSHRPALPAT